MANPQFQILYFSTAAEGIAEGDIEDILEKARINNPTENITGLLLCEEGHFLQLLEGQESKVHALYKKIRADARHTEVTAIFSRNVPHREFENWGMAHYKLTGEDADLKAAFQQVCDTGTAPEVTVHRRASAEQMIDYFRVLLGSPPS